MIKVFRKLLASGAMVLGLTGPLTAWGRFDTQPQSTKSATPRKTPAAAAEQLNPSQQIRKIIASAEAQTTYTNIYDPSYKVIRYPNGDLPRERGVCTDVIVRAFREGAGIDLQKEIHEDMLRNFRAYPQRYGLKKPDPNIDHRRVPNLMTYFRRQGKAVAVSTAAEDYRPGDIVAWDLGGGVLHIGIVSDTWSNASGRYEIIHNIGAGAHKEDRLFDWRVIAHYRY
ncbi:MAG: DUF1287 domain-containing protein [Acidobacteria bacterium]|nr:DUF1287 domain-containing protein [Acidobacteriota bacterium]MCL5286458.1 DUF1287 domain-containing protein [Acidobacteriota bacterium]